MVKASYTKADTDAKIKAMKAGDPDAYGQLCEMIYGRTMVICRVATGNYHEAADVCQEVFVKLEKLLLNLKPPYNLYSYTRRMAHGIKVDRYNKWKRYIATDPEAFLGFSQECFREPIDDLILKETQARVQEVLATFPPLDRAFLMARYGRGGRMKEVARIYGVSFNVLRNRMMVIRPRLKRLFKAAGLDPAIQER